VLEKKGERDHLSRWIAKLEVITSLHAKGKVMQEVHDVSMAKHHGEKTTRELLGKTFYWHEMK
jgi:hypothetical protein